MTIKLFAVTVGLLLLINSVYACPMDCGYPFATQFRVLEQHTGQYGFDDTIPVANATVTATPIQPSNLDLWIFSMFGVKMADVTNVSPESGVTDKDGLVDLPLYQAICYNVTVIKPDGKTSVMRLFPHEGDTYNIFLGG